MPHFSIYKNITSHCFIFIYSIFIIHCSLFTAHCSLPSDTAKAKAKKDTFIVRYFYRKNLDSSSAPSVIKINNSLSGFQLYDPVLKYNFFNANMGNIGLATKNLVFTPSLNFGFDIGRHNFDPYMFNEDTIQYFIVKNPFTEINAVLASRKEQMVDVKHFRNFNKTFNIGIDYRILSSIGEFTRQQTNERSFDAAVDYSAPDKRYYLVAGFIHNRIRANENGGIRGPLEFDPNELGNSNLHNARNTMRETGVNFKQYFQLIKPHNKKDTSSKQSFFNPGVISYYFSFLRQFQAYSDDSTHNNFYPTPKFDSIHTHDSLLFHRFINTFAWSPYLYSKNKNSVLMKFDFKLSYLYSDYFIYDYIPGDKAKSYFHQILPSAGLVANPSGALSFIANLDYVTSGNYNKSDYNFNSELILRLDNNKEQQSTFSHRLILNYNNSSKSPDWTTIHYISNFFNWNNDFKKTNINSISLTYLRKFLNIGINFYDISNYIYFNTEAKPAQASKSFNVIAPFINKTLNIKNFGLTSKIVYQKVSDDAYLRLPEFTLYESLFYNFSLFKKALYLQPGIDFWYTSAYFADAYMPATRIFYIQNKIRLGDYFDFDPYINFMIKRTKFFVKYQNLNYLLNNHKRSLLVPYYVQEDAAFKFGLQWRFFD